MGTVTVVTIEMEKSSTHTRKKLSPIGGAVAPAYWVDSPLFLLLLLLVQLKTTLYPRKHAFYSGTIIPTHPCYFFLFFFYLSIICPIILAINVVFDLWMQRGVKSIQITEKLLKEQSLLRDMLFKYSNATHPFPKIDVILVSILNKALSQD